MKRTHARMLSLALTVLLVASAFTVAQVDSASAAEHSFVVEQGDQCIPVAPIQNGEDAGSFYDYRNPENTDDETGRTYSSYMPSRFTQAETSRLFLYEGPNGVNLVLVHNAVDANTGDSAATFEFSGLPDAGEWVVVDDSYDGQNDRVSRTQIDWTWAENRTDGGVFRGLDRDGLSLTITPRFNDDATLYDDTQREGQMTNWQVLSGSFDDPQPVWTLDMSRSITIRTGTCDVETPTPTSTPTPTPEPTTTTTTQTPTTTRTEEPTPEPTTTTTTRAPEPTPGSGGGGSGGSGGGGSGGGSGGDDDDRSVSEILGGNDDSDDDPGSLGMSVDIEQTAEGSLHVLVEGANGAETVSVEPDRPPIAGGVEYRKLEMAVETTGDFELDVSAATEAPENVSAPTAEQGIEPLSYLTVDHPNLDDAAVSDATVQFAVSEETLAERNVSAEHVALFHHEEGEWAETETELVDQADGTYVYEATTSNLSTFAVGARGAATSVASVELSSETVRVNEPVTVTATVENAGYVEGTRTVNLTMFDEVVASKQVEVPAGESVEVTFEQTVSAPGTYTVQVGNASTDLTVEGTTTTESTTTTGNERGQPGFGPLAALVALLAVVVLVRRRT